MKIGTLNVNGLRAATRKGLRSWLEKSDLDILCLQEVRMNIADCKEEHKPPVGWFSAQVDAQKKGYSGVAIWSKTKPVQVVARSGLPLADTEGRILKFVYPNLVLYSMYFPSGTSGTERQKQKMVFLQYMTENSQAIQAEHEHVLICGDVNIAHTALDICRDKANAKKSGFLPEERKWVDDFLDDGWIDVYRSLNKGVESYSWWTNRSKTARKDNVGWRIDYHFATKKLAQKAKSAVIVERSTNLSDHSCVIVDYDLS